MPLVQESRLDIIGYRAISLPNAIAYRNIFRIGFERKSDEVTGDPYETLYYRSHVNEADPKAGDMWPGSAHCGTTKLDVAALFPSDTKIETTWIFVVYVQNGFNTYEQQQLDSWQVLERHNYAVFEVEEIRKEVTWPLYAEEFATLEIPARHVLGCVRCERNWNSGDWHSGGSFRLTHPLYWNTRNIDPTLSKRRVDAAFRKLMKCLEFHSTGKIPRTV